MDDPVLIIGATCATGEALARRLAGLVFAGGSIVLAPLGRARAADFLAADRLNVVAAAVAARPALSLAVGSGVGLFSSIAARRGFPNHAVIGAAKAAVEGLTLALAALDGGRSSIGKAG